MFLNFWKQNYIHNGPMPMVREVADTKQEIDANI
jgi:hypothetical protein